jgi:anti-sigma factor RsiW
MSRDYLTCRQLVELVTDYLDGALDEQTRARFEEHVMTCPPCHAHIDQMRRTIEALGHVPEETLSGRAEQDLLEAFRGWRRSLTGPGRARP